MSTKSVSKKLSKSIKSLIDPITKSKRAISKSVNKNLDGPFDKYNLFEKIGLEDHCWEKNGTRVSGPGIFCSIVIFWIILSTVIHLLMYNEYKKFGLTNKQILFR